MIVNRILDVVFRTLDAVDAARERFETVFGRKDAPSTTSWPPMPTDEQGGRLVATPDAAAVDGGGRSADNNDNAASPSRAQRARTRATPAGAPAAPRAPGRARRDTAARIDDEQGGRERPPARTRRDASTSSKPAAAAPTPGSAKTRKKPRAPGTPPPPPNASSVGRKGSVDRSGRDYDSPRARAVAAAIRSSGARVVGPDDALDGKKLVARVLWAVGAADDAGIDGGLTAADVSALLSLAASIEVFATNVGRILRDESSSFAEVAPDGRSRRYTLTAEGRARRDALMSSAR